MKVQVLRIAALVVSVPPMPLRSFPFSRCKPSPFQAFCSGVAVLPGQIVQESVLLLLGEFCKELARKVLVTADQPLTRPAPSAKVDLTAGVGRVVGVGGRLLETAFAGMGSGSGSGSDDFREVLAGLKTGSGKESSEQNCRQTQVWVLDAEDVSSVIALLTSAQAMVRQSLQAASLSIEHEALPSPLFTQYKCNVTCMAGSLLPKIGSHCRPAGL